MTRAQTFSIWRKTRLLFLMVWLCTNIEAQNSISGTINIYTPVTDIACNHLVVGSASGFAAGNRVLVIQMKGADADTSNSSSFGNILAYHNSGNYEFATISSISGNLITLGYDLVNAYTIQGLVQLVSVPQYTNVTVSGPLSCLPWNGSTGGVLVFEAAGSVSLGADMDVSGKGFRGGKLCTNPDGGCGNGYFNYYYPVNSGFGAEKGEGITTVSLPKMGGMGALGNGGGGGNKHNSGGGGGSNYSAGGKGGNQANFCPPSAVGGEGGKVLSYTTQQKIFLGGGGGCSDNNNGVGTFGTDGGGIIIARAASINGNGFALRSNGINEVIIPNGIGDGAGGGGAGGAILLDVPVLNGSLVIQANGGSGGGQNCTYSACFGTGGGGGIGFIATSAAAFPGSVTAGSVPGSAGLDVNPSSQCFNTSYGAAAGQAGSGIKTSYVFTEGHTTTVVNVNAGNSTSICAGDTTTLGAAATAGVTYSWTPSASLSSGSANNPKAFPVNTTIYTVTAIYSNGCSASATVQVTALPGGIISIVSNTAICAGDSAMIGTAPIPGTTYSWVPAGSLSSAVISNPKASPAATTIYTLMSSGQNGCAGSATVQVTLLSGSVDAGNDKTICAGDSTHIGSASIPGLVYAWVPAGSLAHPNSGSPVASPSVTTIYTVTCSAPPGNCSFSDTMRVTIIHCDTTLPGQVIAIPNVFTPNGDGINEHFKITALYIKSLHCTIYNRWGEKMHDWEGADGSWNGNAPGGQQAPEGTYFYIASITDEKLQSTTYRGFLTLTR